MNPFIKAKPWYEAIGYCQQKGISYTLITILTAAGSTPREAGAKMLVTEDGQFDTIGGGHLEFVAIEKARDLLAKGEHCQSVESFPLSAALGQCCGGAVKVLFEAHIQHSQTIAVFGGGHVAKALVPIIAQLPISIKWVDTRSATFDQVTMPQNVECLFDEDPISEIANLPTKAWVVIITHNHQLDYELVEQGLKQGNLGFLGMIGSQTKADRFRLRLKNRGFSDAQIATMVSPIGELSVNGKRPIEVAVSISAQLINLLNKSESSPNTSNNKLTTEAAQEQTS